MTEEYNFVLKHSIDTVNYIAYNIMQLITRRNLMSTSVSVRISEDLVQKLDEITRETERSRAFHIQKALEAYFEELADLQIAIDRLHDVTDSVISLDEIRKELEV